MEEDLESLFYKVINQLSEVPSQNSSQKQISHEKVIRKLVLVMVLRFLWAFLITMSTYHRQMLIACLVQTIHLLNSKTSLKKGNMLCKNALWWLDQKE